MPNKKPQVFLDANIVIRSGKPPGRLELERIVDLVDADIISILSTDLTITEVAKKHATNDYDVIKEIGRTHFRKIVEEVVDVKLPEVTKTVLKEKLIATYHSSVGEMFAKLKAKMLTIDEIKPSIVFNDYSAGEGFFSGEAKKDQFPDAFIFECLKKVTSENSPVLIVSDDGDFEASAKAYDNITLIKSLPELFAELGFQMDAPEIEEFLDENTIDLVELANQELSDWGLIGDVEDSEIYKTEVINVDLKKLTAFKPVEEGDPLLVVATLSLDTNIFYSHPDWDTAMYDSEDKIRIPFESVDGETEISFNVDVSISISVDEEGQPDEIEELYFRNSDFQYVELHPYDPYEFM